ncbi:GNAT family N-acetyltransferase [Sanguibacter sp. HDW7]|uniref:GNAT family N-acetyltransferase n=1 Tax=Sanguibacter sp. HDW7 TaxID=2714931 RepID=UPI00140C58BC|nr:GNAT family N-acetyltransferase [Sanguibacter sp. HDW7]QIK82266.1 N-acetyltransferase [Sanguibacter sp. HDW7]
MEITVVHDPDLELFEARSSAGDRVGDVTYRRDGDVWDLVGTHVPPELGGRGIASAMLRDVLAQIRAVDGKVRPTCPFVVAYLDRHPDEATRV